MKASSTVNPSSLLQSSNSQGRLGGVKGGFGKQHFKALLK
jgi:hypothetical protein